MAAKRARGVLKSRLKPALPTWPHSEPLNVTRALRDIDLMRPRPLRTHRRIEYSNIGSSPITPYLGRKVQFHRRFATEEVSRKPIMALEEVSGSVEYPLMTGNPKPNNSAPIIVALGLSVRPDLVNFAPPIPPGELASPTDTALYHEIPLVARLTPKMCMPAKTNQIANEHCTSDINHYVKSAHHETVSRGIRQRWKIDFCKPARLHCIPTAISPLWSCRAFERFCRHRIRRFLNRVYRIYAKSRPGPSYSGQDNVGHPIDRFFVADICDRAEIFKSLSSFRRSEMEGFRISRYQAPWLDDDCSSLMCKTKVLACNLASASHVVKSDVACYIGTHITR
ncbi:hypothetical protein DBV15_01098 [Temnothorax longispinosus]|uniref:Uncharacterized protein n=1 Tax=Temnothorax longispinosus TaxID=300112 RepID=A0A4S2JBV2_9HYME|nr:hypothetical protein DBV15_01098 [Temnothorax longispinosus]